jgi:nicotinamidase-related amidase
MRAIHMTLLLTLAVAAGPPAGQAEQAGARPEGKTLELKGRYREEGPGGTYAAKEKSLRWEPAQTALIVCDMWDQHWCKGANRRVGELVPTMDRFVGQARRRGVMIFHAPSSCMEFYKDHPARKRALEAPAAANLPAEIAAWCRQIPAEEKGRYPIDQSDGGCDCTPTCQTGSPWRRQVESIRIADEDAISDSGVEIWSLFEQRGIRNVILVGVHTNMCVLGRPFGLRNMARYGKTVVLVRDLTDTMYNPRSAPFVDHFTGTDLIVEHIEKFVCPTITSDQLLGGSPFRFQSDTRR